jgi:rhodanese-related sulfurtransferase
MGFLSGLFSGGGASIDVAEAARRLDAGEIILVDVREKSEWRGGHAPQARHVPLTTIGPKLDALAGHDKPVAFVCRSGHRSGAACRAARARGIEAINVRGGMPAWQRAGLPVAKG